MTTPRARAVQAAAIGGVAVAGHWVARRRAAMREVSPELRLSPLLLLPLVPGHDGVVRTLQLLGDRAHPRLPEHARLEHAPGRDRGPDVPVVVYDLPGRERPSGVLVWVHGGGRVVGSAHHDHAICLRVAEGAGVLVVSVDYRLAPDHPFPAALDDISAVLDLVHAEAGRLGIDPERVAIGGSSAGAGLAAEASQRAFDEGVPLAHQLLIYPMLDDRTLPGRVPRRPWWVWTPQHNRYAWSAYLGHPAGEPEDRPYAVAARREDLAGLPPAWIGVGEVDLFLAEATRYAERLRAAGVPAELHVEPGMPHGVDQGSPAPSMLAFRDRAVTAVRDAVGAEVPAGSSGPSTPVPQP